MPKRDEDKDDFFMDDSMSMQAESPNVLYYIYIYILWAKESPTAVDPPTAEAQSTRRMC